MTIPIPPDALTFSLGEVAMLMLAALLLGGAIALSIDWGRFE